MKVKPRLPPTPGLPSRHLPLHRPHRRRDHRQVPRRHRRVPLVADRTTTGMRCSHGRKGTLMASTGYTVNPATLEAYATALEDRGHRVQAAPDRVSAVNGGDIN